MPVIDIRALRYTVARMNAGALVLLADVHNDHLARLVVEALLHCGGVVRALFLELPEDSRALNGYACVPIANNFGVYLDDAAQAMSRMGLNANEARSSSEAAILPPPTLMMVDSAFQ